MRLVFLENGPMLSIKPSSLPRLAACALVFAAACSDSSKKSAVDADLAHDLALSNQVAVQPAFKDTALAPAPAAAQPAAEPVVRQAPRRERVTSPAPRREPAIAAPQPTPEPQAAGPAASTSPAPSEIGAGTSVGLTTGGRVCSQTNRAGDKIVATVNAPVVGRNGAVIPAGSAVVLEIASVTPGSSPETSTIEFRVRSVDINGVSYPASGDVTAAGGLERSRVPNSGSSMDKEKVIGGAIAGAIIGRIIGHGSTKGTVLGGAAGAAAGAAASRADVQYEGCLPSGAPLHLTLSESITLTAAR